MDTPWNRFICWLRGHQWEVAPNLSQQGKDGKWYPVQLCDRCGKQGRD
jgi:hypothetical protein